MSAAPRQSAPRIHPLTASALCAALLAACSAPPPLLPPPFGPDTNAPKPPRLFFPTGLAVHPTSGHLLVVNGNFNHEFDSGTLVSIDPTYLADLFAGAVVHQGDPAYPMPVDLPNGVNDARNVFLGAVMIGSYGGPLLLDKSGLHAYVGSRDSSTLNGVTIDPTTGKLSCLYAPAGSTDCRSGIVNTRTSYNLEGPYTLLNGFARLPGTPTTAPDQEVMFVNQLSPSVDYIDNNLPYTSARVAALLPYDASNTTATGPTQYYTAVASDPNTAAGIGAGPVVFDEGRRQLILGGCYNRYSSGSVGEPSSAKCSNILTNYLRFMGVDEGANAGVRLVDIRGDVLSTDTEALALGSLDTSTSPPLYRTLYVATRSPDLLAEYDLPSDPRQPLLLRRAAPMPISPAQILILKRPASFGQSLPDLVLVSSEANGSVAIYDATAGQVVAQVERLGTAPFAMVQLADSADGTKAQVALSIFQDCRIALIDIDYARPWQARLRARLGSCPP
jgi:DNA-binding beta-propeller fold protein YncE